MTLWRWLAALTITGLVNTALAQSAPLTRPAEFHLDIPVRIGILTAMSRNASFPMWGATVDRLRIALPAHELHVEALDIAAVHRATVSGKFDFIILNPGLYTELKHHGLRRLVSLKSPFANSPERSLASTIFTRSERTDINALADLKGKRVEGVDRHGFGGWQLAWREMQLNGINPASDFASLSFSGYPYRSTVDAVLNGRADVGVVRSCVIEQLERDGALARGSLKVINPRHNDDLRCEHSTQAYPDWLLVATAGTPSLLARELTTALLTMKPASDGFEWMMAGDYRLVDELFRALKLGPYAYPPAPTAIEVVRRFWIGFMVIGVLALIGMLHVALTQRTVRRRTAELRQALDVRDALERERQNQQERIDHLARIGMLGEISSMVAHEINQPLAAIGSFARGLERRLQAGADPRPLASVAQDIALQSERAGEIVKRIRNFARKRSIDRQAHDLCAVTTDAMALFAGGAIQHPALESHLPASAKVMGDAIQLQQVIVNLIKNAIDAPRPAQARPWVGISLEHRAPMWRLVVEDNGIPLDAAAVSQFFEPFFTTKLDGLGLGLSICHGIIEAHGGRMLVEPRAAGGLAVGFELPELTHEQSS
ncbi:MAG: PhnD/SsuA/transferrin family substrate-binding protein [Burkholderiaceae bacterium]